MNMFEKIKNAVPDKEFDAVLVLSPVNRRYITGFPSSAGYVIVRPDKTVFITDFRYYEAAKKKCGNGIEVILQKKLYDQINACLESCKKVLVEESFITIFSFEVLKEKLSEKILYTGASEALGVLRSVKTQEEICKIAKAQQITDDAFSYIVNYIADNLGLGLTEAQVALELEYYMRSNGSHGIAFNTIAVSGAKSAMPHGAPADIPLSRGFLTMDFGAAYEGYCSDMTRTICIGKPTEKMKDVYDAVLNAQIQALEYISAGKTGKDVDGIARAYINYRGYEGKFGHSLGHSLGLEVHETPHFSASNEKSIPCGAVLSVEPGIYLEGEFGVRIEDIVNITENGCKNLTKSSKELIVL